MVQFEELFKSLLSAQKVIGIAPFAKTTSRLGGRSAVYQTLYSILATLFFYNIFYQNIPNHDHPMLLKNSSVCMIFIVITVKYCTLRYYRETVLDLMNNMKKDYAQSKELSVEELQIVEKYAYAGKAICNQWVYLGMASPSSFLIKSLFLMVYYYFKGEFRRVPYYEMTYLPAIVEENKDRNIYCYLAMYAVMAAYGYYTGFVYIAYVPLGPIFMLHACGQLEIVKLRIVNLYKEPNLEIVNEKLKKIIQKMQYVYSFVDSIQSLFIIIYEVTLKLTALLFPFAAYEVLQAKNRGEFSMECCTFIAGGILVSGTPCYYSDMLMEKGEDVRMALYTSGWEMHYNKPARSMVLMILSRTLRPTALTTIFQTLSLNTFGNLLQESYAIFNLINTMWA